MWHKKAKNCQTFCKTSTAKLLLIEEKSSEHYMTNSLFYWANVSELVISIVNEENVVWAVFDLYKSAGPDDIFPALLQRSLPVI